MLTAGGCRVLQNQGASSASVDFVFVITKDVPALIFKDSPLIQGRTVCILYGRNPEGKVIRPITLLPHGRYVITIPAAVDKLPELAESLLHCLRRLRDENRLTVALGRQTLSIFRSHADVRVRELADHSNVRTLPESAASLSASPGEDYEEAVLTHIRTYLPQLFREYVVIGERKGNKGWLRRCEWGDLRREVEALP
jgi:hypothetical protein